ncbi:glycoside hydrolase superfamily [Cadophora sp. MPI-SDFR-AT-0126]|nr:glycoside hydrolase superfamily [Leotiomycetes sp. MPI-SDFR-AT-0126]
MMKRTLLLSLLALTASSQTPPVKDPSQVKDVVASAITSLFPSPSLLTSQILQTFLSPISTLLARNSHIYRNGASLYLNGERWTASGANVYWLGLDENVEPPSGEPYYAPFKASYPTKGRTTEIMRTLVTMGAKLIRSQTLGVSVGNPLSLMPAKGVVNMDAFEAIDWAVFQARQHGLRIIAPLVDNFDYYHGGKFTFLRWHGYNISGSDSPLPPDTMKFYTDAAIINTFKNYIEILMMHVNPYTGLSYADDPTIIGYETGNELNGIVWGDKDVPVDWIVEICTLIKALGLKKLCIDGTYGVNKTHFVIEEVDIFSDHFYPLNNTLLESDIAAVEGADRVYIAGELGWTAEATAKRGDSLRSFYEVIEKRQRMERPVVAGSLIWSLFGRNLPQCETYVPHSDGFTMHYGSPNNSAADNAQISTMRQHYFAMQGISVDSYLPSVPCPGNYIPGYDAEYTYV